MPTLKAIADMMQEQIVPSVKQMQSYHPLIRAAEAVIEAIAKLDEDATPLDNSPNYIVHENEVLALRAALAAYRQAEGRQPHHKYEGALPQDERGFEP